MQFLKAGFDSPSQRAAYHAAWRQRRREARHQLLRAALQASGYTVDPSPVWPYLIVRVRIGTKP